MQGSTTGKARSTVNAEIESFIAGKDTVAKSWIVKHLMDIHRESFADDFAVQVAHDAFDAYARHYINRLKPRPEQDPQLVMPGFKHLQVRYVVNREGESTVVRTEQMSPEEFDAQIAQHEAHSAGHAIHADELRKFKAKLYGEAAS